jgi:hypothetical protein
MRSWLFLITDANKSFGSIRVINKPGSLALSSNPPERVIPNGRFEISDGTTKSIYSIYLGFKRRIRSEIGWPWDAENAWIASAWVTQVKSILLIARIRSKRRRLVRPLSNDDFELWLICTMTIAGPQMIIFYMNSCCTFY